MTKQEIIYLILETKVNLDNMVREIAVSPKVYDILISGHNLCQDGTPVTPKDRHKRWGRLYLPLNIWASTSTVYQYPYYISFKTIEGEFLVMNLEDHYAV